MEISGKQAELLRGLPRVDTVMARPEWDVARRENPQTLKAAVRRVLENIRQEIQSGKRTSPILDSELSGRISSCYISFCGMRPVINANGVILHTNLGRAPLSRLAVEAAQRAASGYTDLEFDLDSGTRANRTAAVEALLCRLTGAEDAIAVNNNAAAVILCLAVLAKGKPVAVSRGELVEIGGSFRIPEILQQSGSPLLEIGTTNRTYLSDYENAAAQGAALLLKVHSSNYRIIGFTESVAISELAALGNRLGLPVVHDVGGGLLADLSPYGICEEPSVRQSVKDGADITTFSGDKLLGGPQCGLAVGKRSWISQMKRHPLARAFRLDKVTLASLEATLLSYENGREFEEIPVLSMLCAATSSLELRAQKLCSLLRGIGISAQIRETEGQVGGGTLPEHPLPGYGVSFSAKFSAQELEARLRHAPVPVLARISKGQVIFDVRTVPEEQLPFLVQAVQYAFYGENG